MIRTLDLVFADIYEGGRRRRVGREVVHHLRGGSRADVECARM
jgi:hypothetical protein